MPNTSCAVMLTVLAAACASPSTRLARMYAALRQDSTVEITNERAQLDLARRQRERVADVRQLDAQGQISGAHEHFEAAMILVGSDEIADLTLAEAHGLEAAKLGFDPGFRVAAEAVDKQQVKKGLHQRYGTQYAYDVTLKSWRLYPVDPRTSDAERKAMGIPPMAEILAGEAQLNRNPNPLR